MLVFLIYFELLPTPTKSICSLFLKMVKSLHGYSQDQNTNGIKWKRSFSYLRVKIPSLSHILKVTIFCYGVKSDQQRNSAFVR